MIQPHKFFLVEKDEAGTVYYFLVFLIVVGFGMALGNATANALFLKRFGIENLPLIYMVQSGAFFLTSLVYTSVADLISAERFFKILFALIAALVLTFWILISQYAYSAMFPAYFLFYEVVSEVLLIHCALYLNQNLNTLQAKRLSPIIFSGQQIGMILGGLFLTAYASVVGTTNILVAWFILVTLALILVAVRHKLKGPSPYYRATRKSVHKLQHMSSQIKQGFRFAITSELLRFSTIAMVFMVITYYIISYSVKSVYTRHYVVEEDLTAFFGVLAILTSGLALTVQLFFTSRLIHRFGVPVVNLFFPLVSLGSFAGMIFHLSMPTAIFGSLNIKAVMPAIHNPVRTMFLNVLPQHIQGRARAMSIAIVLPVSLFICGALLWLLQRLNNPVYFLIPGIIAAGLFLYYTIRMNRAYGKTLLDHLKEHLFLPEEQSATSLRLTGKDNLASIIDAISNGKDSSVSMARILIEAYPELAAKHVLPAIASGTPKIADQLLKTISTTHDPAIENYLVENHMLHDNHFHTTAMKQLINSRTEKAIPLVRQALDDPDPRICAMGIHGILSWPLVKLHDKAVAKWNTLLNGSEKQQLAAIGLIKDIKHIVNSELQEKIAEECQLSTERLFHSQNSTGKIYILNSYTSWTGKCNPIIEELVSSAMEHIDPRVRAAAVQSSHLLPQDLYLDKLEGALNDGHARVRDAAAGMLNREAPVALVLARQWILEDNRGTPRSQITLLNAVIENMPHATLELIVNNKIEDARQIYRALVTVRGHRDDNNRTLRLFQYVLEERFQQILEIILTAMEPLCAPNVISIIRAGIRTYDDRYIANACEALNSIPNRIMTRPLGELIQDAFMPRREQYASSSDNIENILESLSMRSDPWLRQCAGSLLPTFKGRGIHD